MACCGRSEKMARVFKDVLETETKPLKKKEDLDEVLELLRMLKGEEEEWEKKRADMIRSLLLGT